ncbi:hypothetical protein LZ30DRAFT_699689 [Colletotrichum cereale]|nr:hypothetical protein LZ30DRAFT_699689 [Colletotrichum cereale]
MKLLLTSLQVHPKGKVLQPAEHVAVLHRQGGFASQVDVSSAECRASGEALQPSTLEITRSRGAGRRDRAFPPPHVLHGKQLVCGVVQRHPCLNHMVGSKLFCFPPQQLPYAVEDRWGGGARIDAGLKRETAPSPIRTCFSRPIYTLSQGTSILQSSSYTQSLAFSYPTLFPLQKNQTTRTLSPLHPRLSRWRRTQSTGASWPPAGSPRVSSPSPTTAPMLQTPLPLSLSLTSHSLLQGPPHQPGLPRRD